MLLRIYQIATDDEKQKALMGMFTKEGMVNLYEGLQEEAKSIGQDPEKAKHFVGQTTVSVVTLVTGISIISKGGKISNIIEDTTSKLNELSNPKLISILEKLRNTEKYKPEILKAIEGFFNQLNPELLAKISKIENFDIVLKEMAQQWKKFHGSKFMFNNLEEKGDDFIKRIDKFEAKSA